MMKFPMMFKFVFRGNLCFNKKNINHYFVTVLFFKLVSLLCRIPGIRSFGIEDKEFKVYVDTALLDDESLLKRVKGSVKPHHDVDRSSLQAWQEPIFHHRIGDLIEGKDNRRGMITTFAEMVDSNWKNPKASKQLYFITCEHVAPEKEMRVFFLKCSKCDRLYL